VTRTHPAFVIIFFVGVSIGCTIFQTEFWPFSHFPMFSNRAKLEAPQVKLEALTATGAVLDPFLTPSLLYPADRFLVLRAFQRMAEDGDRVRAKKALEWLASLARKNRQNGAQEGPAIALFRLVVGADFKVEVLL